MFFSFMFLLSKSLSVTLKPFVSLVAYATFCFQLKDESESGDDSSASNDQDDESHDGSRDEDRLSNAASSDEESTADSNMAASSDDDGDSESESSDGEQNPDPPITGDSQLEDFEEFALQLLKGKSKT